MMGLNEAHRPIELHSTRVSNGNVPNLSPDNSSSHLPPKHSSLFTLILSCTIAAGVQFGWALQLSFLTPYIQMIVSLGAGLWDALFGGGNIPTFILVCLSALVASIVATLKLPNLAKQVGRFSF